MSASHFELRKKLESHGQYPAALKLISGGIWFPVEGGEQPAKRFGTRSAAKFYAENRRFQNYTIVEITVSKPEVQWA